MRSFSETFLFDWESADLLMSWHTPYLPKSGIRYDPLFSQSPFFNQFPLHIGFGVTLPLKKTKILVNLLHIKGTSN